MATMQKIPESIYSRYYYRRLAEAKTRLLGELKLIVTLENLIPPISELIQHGQAVIEELHTFGVVGVYMV